MRDHIKELFPVDAGLLEHRHIFVIIDTVADDLEPQRRARTVDTDLVAVIYERTVAENVGRKIAHGIHISPGVLDPCPVIAAPVKKTVGVQHIILPKNEAVSDAGHIDVKIQIRLTGLPDEDLIKIRDELIAAIWKYEHNEVPKEEYGICPSPQTVYWCNLEYLIETCKLVEAAYSTLQEEDDEEEEEDADFDYKEHFVKETGRSFESSTNDKLTL